MGQEDKFCLNVWAQMVRKVQKIGFEDASFFRRGGQGHDKLLGFSPLSARQILTVSRFNTKRTPLQN